MGRSALAALLLATAPAALAVPQHAAPPAPPAPESYESVQYVGFPIQTGYDGYLGANMYYIEESGGVGVYPGYADTAADIKGRLAVMEAALEASLTAPDLDLSNSTLKIFMAPEFFFRGPVGAYSAEDPALMQLGDSLRSMVADTRWRDWIFVFGSIIGANKIADPKALGSEQK